MWSARLIQLFQSLHGHAGARDAIRKNTGMKIKDPSGGTTGRVKPYGRWGGWALAPEYGLDGEELSLPPIRSRQGHWAFNPLAIFFGLFERRL